MPFFCCLEFEDLADVVGSDGVVVLVIDCTRRKVMSVSLMKVNAVEHDGETDACQAVDDFRFGPGTWKE